jgi:ABC-type Mn2+/Zn2+ transport system ATPase subunit
VLLDEPTEGVDETKVALQRLRDQYRKAPIATAVLDRNLSAADFDAVRYLSVDDLSQTQHPGCQIGASSGQGSLREAKQFAAVASH